MSRLPPRRPLSTARSAALHVLKAKGLIGACALERLVLKALFSVPIAEKRGIIT